MQKKIIKMKTTSVALGAYFDEYIKLKIKEGRYNNASEMLRAALRLLEDEETRQASLKTAIVVGIESGISEQFDPESHLASLKSKRANA